VPPSLGDVIVSPIQLGDVMLSPHYVFHVLQGDLFPTDNWRSRVYSPIQYNLLWTSYIDSGNLLEA